MKIIKAIGLFLCVLLLFVYLRIPKKLPALDYNEGMKSRSQAAIERIQTKDKPESFPIELSYLSKKPDDTFFFGDSLAVSDRYLAVGDRGANRVVVYLRQADNSWLRSYEIYPSKPLIGKYRESNFGSEIEIKDNTLIAYSYIGQDFWGNQVATEKVKRKLYLVKLSEEHAENLRTIDLSAKNSYMGEAKFLGNNIALFAREKNADNETTSNHIDLIDPLTGKRVKNIELAVSGYKDTDFDGLSLDSDGENLFVLPLRISSFKSKPPLLITKDGSIQQVTLPIQFENLTFFSEYESYITSNRISVTNQLLAISVKLRLFDSQTTIFWKRFPQIEWIDTLGLIGKMSGEEGNMLISYSRSGRLFRKKPDYTFLKFSPDQKTFSQSDIEWSCGVEENEQYLASTLGLVDGDNLILGAYGTVAIVPIENLTNSQTLYNPSCRSN